MNHRTSQRFVVAVVAALAFSVVALTAPSTPAAGQRSTCGGVAIPAGYNLIDESGSDNVEIAGTAGHDFICANAEDNIISGMAGDDIIVGRGGNDEIEGNRGNDEIHAKAGRDVVRGGPGKDTIFGGVGKDTLRGGAGGDIIDGGRGEDTVKGGGGKDECVAEDTAGCELPEPPTSTDPVFADARFEVQVTSDVVYAQGLSHSEWNEGPGTPTDLLLDTYEPVRNDASAMPAIVMIHGGGFKGGTKRKGELVEMAQDFASRGWVAFSIDYRVAGNHGTLPDDYPVFPDNPEIQDQANALYPACRDAKAAIRWIRANAETYNIAPESITALGGSAGSYLSIALGVSNEEDCVSEISTTNDPTLADTNLDYSSNVQTIIDHWGGDSILAVLELIDGESRYDAGDAPISIVHGTADRTVEFAHAERLRDAYTETGAPYEFHPLDGKGHGVWNATIDGVSLWQDAFNFIVEHQDLDVR